MEAASINHLAGFCEGLSLLPPLPLPRSRTGEFPRNPTNPPPLHTKQRLTASFLPSSQRNISHFSWFLRGQPPFCCNCVPWCGIAIRQAFKQPSAFPCLGLDCGLKCLAYIIRSKQILMILVLLAGQLRPRFSPKQEKADSCFNAWAGITRCSSHKNHPKTN